MGGIASVIGQVLVAIITTFLQFLVQAATWLLHVSIFNPYQMNAQATADATVMRDIGLFVIVLSVAWAGIRGQISSVARLPGRGADFESVVLAAVACIGAFWLSQQLLLVNNAVVAHFYGLIMRGGAQASLTNSLGAAVAAIAAEQALTQTALAMFYLPICIALLVLLAILALIYVLRSAEIVFFAVTMPLWAALYSIPETAGVVGAAFVELGVAIFTQALQVIGWWLATTLILSSALASPSEAGPFAPLMNLLTAVGVVYLLVKMPGTLRRLLRSQSGSRTGFLGELASTTMVAARMPALAQTMRTLPWLP